MQATVFDTRRCALGEGAFWHPERAQFFWFDINGKQLLTQENGQARHWQFSEHVSAAGWIDHDRLLIASETALFRFDLVSGERKNIVPLEADSAATRSNDGRADPMGGFWIGTMGKHAEKEAGAIYRYAQGQLRRLCADITIPNAICFSPDGRYAYYTDTPSQRILKQALDCGGWPEGTPELFVDLRPEGLNPDGAVVDADGHLWVALWGSGRVQRFGQDGTPGQYVSVSSSQPSCPSFGGHGLKTMFITTAQVDNKTPNESDGQTFFVETPFAGQTEHRLHLDDTV